MLGLLWDSLKRLTVTLVNAARQARRRFQARFRLQISMSVDAGIGDRYEGLPKPSGEGSKAMSGPKEVTATKLAPPAPASPASPPHTIAAVAGARLP
jgi:hypothetical protein